MFGQSFVVSDLWVVGVLGVLEILLSADNALVLAILARPLPHQLQRRALMYGMGGAIVLRLAAIILAKHVLAFWWLQTIGAVYLIHLPIRHFARSYSKPHPKEVSPVGGVSLWRTVVAVELADIAFALDSVLAGVAMIRDASRLWVILAGAMIGVLALRLAAVWCVRLIERYPSLDGMAYLLVGWVGVKLAVTSAHNAWAVFRWGEIGEMLVWVYWMGMGLIFVAGVLHAARHRRRGHGAEQPHLQRGAGAK